jgi:hypothetical protein
MDRDQGRGYAHDEVRMEPNFQLKEGCFPLQLPRFLYIPILESPIKTGCIATLLLIGKTGQEGCLRNLEKPAEKGV